MIKAELHAHTVPELVRALYVAATRARDWLWLLTPEQWSPLVA